MILFLAGCVVGLCYLTVPLENQYSKGQYDKYSPDKMKVICGLKNETGWDCHCTNLRNAVVLGNYLGLYSCTSAC